jgi:hypothetical protein
MIYFQSAVVAGRIAILICLNEARKCGGFEVYAVRISAQSVNIRRRIYRVGNPCWF